MDRERVKAEAAFLPAIIGLDDPESLQRQIHTTQGLDETFERLVKELTRIAEASTPRRKANTGFQSPWWNAEVQEKADEVRRAERMLKEAPTVFNRAQLHRKQKRLSKAVKDAKTRTWRTTLQDATQNSTLLWKLERWARCKSFKATEPPQLPALKDQAGRLQTTFLRKAEILADRFFPNPPADLTDIHDPGLTQPWEPKFQIDQTVTPEDIRHVLSRASPWKAPGNDYLPTGLLKACGDPLCKVLAVLTQRCFELSWMPERFKEAIAIVLPKAGKKPADYQTPGGYRPISLLPAIGKVMEAVMTRRFTAAAETYGLIPDEQMGNREHRSTELAIRLVTA
jgi:hypothetical protein